MSVFPPTIILRHNRENLKKCSLRGLEGHSDYIFYSYPWIKPQPDLTQYVLLTLDAPLLSPEDGQKGIFLIDGTWRYAQKMEKSLPQPFERRSLPKVKTAYPRRQEDCSDPDVGLASIEALYLAFLILGRDSSGLLNNYYWKEEFLFNISNSKLTLPFADKLK